MAGPTGTVYDFGRVLFSAAGRNRVRRESSEILRAAALAVGAAGAFAGKPRQPLPQSSGRRRTLAKIVDDAAILAALFGRQLLKAAIKASEWFAAFEAMLRARYRAAALALVGAVDPNGILDLSEGDEAETARRSDEQIAFLLAFSRQLNLGLLPLDGRVISRSTMYGRAVWALGMGIERASVLRSVLTPGAREFERIANTGRSIFLPRIRVSQERRVLGVADHCPDCPGLAEAGWQPIGSLPAIGDTICRGWCACHFEYR